MGNYKYKVTKSHGATFFIFLLSFVLGLLTLWDGMAPSEAGAGDRSPLILQKQDSGEEISLGVGDVIQVELAQMGGAGYQWSIEELDTSYLRLVSDETRGLPEGRAGAPVLRIWKIEVIRVGFTEIRMNHYRAWEGVQRSIDHFEVGLNIHP
jgi:predicted secreted protein